MADNEDAPLAPPAGGLDLPFPPPPLEEERFPGERELAGDERNRWLILHVSLSRTVMTRDLVDKRDTGSELNDVLSNMAWAPDARNHFNVSAEDPIPTLEPPEDSMISYADYVARGSADEGRLRALFTTSNEGSKFKSRFDEMVKSLQHSNKALIKAFDMKKVELNDADCEADPNKSVAQNIMRFGRHSIVPSFWQLLIDLVKSGRRFSIVFRAYSEEQLNLFKQEYQMFCEGKHPAFNGQNRTQKPPMMDGSKGSKDYRLSDANIGRWSRKEGKLEFPNRPAPEDLLRFQNRAVDSAEAMAHATSDAAEGADADAEGGEGTAVSFPATFYETKKPDKDTDVYHDVYAGLQHHILGVEAKPVANAIAIVDDLDYWEEHGRASEAAKLLLVDHAGSLAETKVQNIFFDGQIGRDGYRSVDIRNVVDGKPIPYGEANDVFFHRVDFFQAIIDEGYFINALKTCEQTMSQRILQTRQMVDPVAAEQEKPEAIKALESHKDYINRAIIPALAPALEACERDRPANPIEFIAFYMLRHPKQYSKTLKT